MPNVWAAVKLPTREAYEKVLAEARRPRPMSFDRDRLWLEGTTEPCNLQDAAPLPEGSDTPWRRGLTFDKMYRAEVHTLDKGHGSHGWSLDMGVVSSKPHYLRDDTRPYYWVNAVDREWLEKDRDAAYPRGVMRLSGYGCFWRIDQLVRCKWLP